MLSWRRADVLPLVWIHRTKSYFHLLTAQQEHHWAQGCGSASEGWRSAVDDHLIPQSRQTWMSSSIPPSISRFRVKDRPSFTSKTSPDYNRLPRTAHPQPSSRASWLPTLDVSHTILPEAPICPESRSFLTSSSPSSSSRSFPSRLIP